MRVYLWILGAIPVSAVCIWLWSRPCIDLARAWGLWDPPGGRKDHSQPVPMAGGIAFLSAWIAAWLFFVAQQGVTRGAALVFAGGCAAASCGLLDDYRKSRGRGLSAFAKLAGQVVGGLLAWAGGIELQWVGSDWGNGIATVLWIAAVVNAWNFLDNMDGLALGLGVVGAWVFATVFVLLGKVFLSFLAVGIAGLCLGFLPHNFPRARAFLGDGGSHLLGYLFGVLAVEGSYVAEGGSGLIAILVPIAILAIPLFDMAQVILSRLVARQPVYRGDHRHLSFRLARRLGSRRRAVLFLWALALGIGAVSVAIPFVSFAAACALLAGQSALFFAVFLWARG